MTTTRTDNRAAFYGVVGPRELPREISTFPQGAISKVMLDAGVRQRIEDTRPYVYANSQDEFARQIGEEFEVYKAGIAKQQISLD